MLEVTIDGQTVARPDGDDVSVEVSLDDAAHGAAIENPLTWCENAGVRVKGDAVQVWVSVDDPRGGFQMEVRRTEKGRMFIHLPHPEESGPHMETVQLHAGTLEVVGMAVEE